jgi:hypothetical protein
MNAAESESAREPEHFVERDDGETQLPFGEGRVPVYIALVWVTFIVVYIVVMSWLALPDLRAWIQH